MGEKITAIYAKGVLRPLQALNLPENTELELEIVAQQSVTGPAESEHEQARRALRRAGVIQARDLSWTVTPVSDAEIMEAARILGSAGPLSDLILAEREER